MKTYNLAINLGLRSIRAIIFDAKGTSVAKNWYPVTTYIDHKTVEQNPKEWWGLCSLMMHELFDENPELRDNLQSITVTSSASCLVVLDKEGTPLCNSLMVSDKRASAEASLLSLDPELKTLFSNANFSPVESFFFPKVLFLQKRKPALFKKAVHFMNAGDYLMYKLTGKIITDTLNAEKWYYDRKSKTYPSTLLKTTNLTTSNLPQVEEPGTIIGILTKEIQKEFALSPQVTVVLSTYDALCAFMGSGVTNVGEVSNVCGTVSSLRVLTTSKNESNHSILEQHINDLVVAGGSNNIDGGLLEWSKQMFYGDSYPDKYIYRIMEDEAQTSPVGSNGLIFSPYLIGERFPFNDAHVRGIFFGIERFHKRNDIVRSVFEAGSYMAYDMIQEIEKNGHKVSSIRMSGGLTKCPIACRIRADVTGKKIYVIDEIETTSLGALYFIKKANNEVKSLKEFSKNIKIKEVYTPNKKNHALYKQFFTLFKNIYTTNIALMSERKKIMNTVQVKNPFVLENL